MLFILIDLDLLFYLLVLSGFEILNFVLFVQVCLVMHPFSSSLFGDYKVFPFIFDDCIDTTNTDLVVMKGLKKDLPEEWSFDAVGSRMV